jgi:PEGA domain-containing protein
MTPRTPNFKAILLIVGTLALAGVIWAEISVKHDITTANNGTLDLTVVPADAQALIDNQTTTTSDTLSLSPGTHTITFTRNGFGTKTITVNIQAKQTMNQTVVLPATTSIGTAYLQAHPGQVAIGEGVTGTQANQQGQLITQNNPLIALLPYQGSDFRIDVGVSQKYAGNPDAVAIYVTATTAAGRTHALDWIKAQGYDPNAYEIIYQTSTGQ